MGVDIGEGQGGRGREGGEESHQHQESVPYGTGTVKHLKNGLKVEVCNIGAFGFYVF